MKFFILLYITSMLICGCGVKKTMIHSQNEITISNNNENSLVIIDTSCMDGKDFNDENYYQCYKNYLLQFSYSLLNKKFYDDLGLNYLLRICINKYNANSSKNEIDQFLFQFYFTRYENLKDPKYSHSSPMQFENITIQNILQLWNSRKSFEICLLYMSKNRHDSMGDGDCINIGFKFFGQVVRPKIRSINGMNVDTFLRENIKGVYANDEDCFDSYYNALYPLIKKAWEDGKIILVSDENNK